MYAKTIEYTNYNGEKKVKKFYFHLSQSEVLKLDLVENGGLLETLKKMINEDNNKKIVDYFESILLLAYGEKSADGEEFIKNDEIRERFKSHPAYDILFLELIKGGDKAMADFINKCLPSDLQGAAKDQDIEKLLDLPQFKLVNKELGEEVKSES